MKYTLSAQSGLSESAQSEANTSGFTQPQSPTLLADAVDVQDVFGTIEPPEAVERYGLIGDTESAGPIGFVSNIVILITVVAGVWSLVSILLAGFALVTADGDSKKVGEMTSKISNIFLGLLVMVAAPLITALIGLFFFGDAAYFLRPTIFGPGGGN